MAATLWKLSSQVDKPSERGLLLTVHGSMAPMSPGSQRSSNMYHYELDDDGLTESASMLTVPLSRSNSMFDMEQSRSRSSQSETESRHSDSHSQRESISTFQTRPRAGSNESLLVLQDLSHLHSLICNCNLPPEKCPKIITLRNDASAQYVVCLFCFSLSLFYALS